jgi:uncharacterized iron-regulated membrane protein
VLAGAAAGVVILIMSVTGVLLTYQRQITEWADTRGYNVSRPNADASRLPVEALLAKVRETQHAAPSGVTLYSEEARPASVAFAIDRGNGGQPQLRSQLTLNRATGEVVRWESTSNNTAGRRMRSRLRFAHTGEVYGLLGQTIAGLVSLGGAFLVYTGLSLAWRRFYSWRGRRAREQLAPDGVRADAS